MKKLKVLFIITGLVIFGLATIFLWENYLGRYSKYVRFSQSIIAHFDDIDSIFQENPDMVNQILDNNNLTHDDFDCVNDHFDYLKEFIETSEYKIHWEVNGLIPKNHHFVFNSNDQEELVILYESEETILEFCFAQLSRSQWELRSIEVKKRWK